MATRDTTTEGDGHDDGHERPATPATPCDQDTALVAAVQRGDERAMTALYDRYTTILRREARRLGVPAAERGDLVCDTLRGVVLALMRPGRVAPRSLTGYAIISLRNAHRSAVRQAQRAASLERALRQDVLTQPDSEQPVDAADDAPADVLESPGALSRYSRVLAALTAVMGTQLSADEWQLLGWLADYVPQRDIGRWLGISHGAARVRVHRLRERMQKVAQDFGRTLPPLEQRELDRFFRRAGVLPPSTPTRRASRGRSATDAETS